MKRDKGQGVKKKINGKLNPKWVAIHIGTKPPRNSRNCGEDFPQYLSDILPEHYPNI